MNCERSTVRKHHTILEAAQKETRELRNLSASRLWVLAQWSFLLFIFWTRPQLKYLDHKVALRGCWAAKSKRRKGKRILCVHTGHISSLSLFFVCGGQCANAQALRAYAFPLRAVTIRPYLTKDEKTRDLLWADCCALAAFFSFLGAKTARSAPLRGHNIVGLGTSRKRKKEKVETGSWRHASHFMTNPSDWLPVHFVVPPFQQRLLDNVLIFSFSWQNLLIFCTCMARRKENE